MTGTLLVVCEAPADCRISADLADRVIGNSLAVDPSTVRRWYESEPGRSYIRWIDLDKVAEARGLRLRPRSRFGGQPGAADAAAADKALLLAMFIAKNEGLVGVLLIRDSDGYDERRIGLNQARTTDPGMQWPFSVTIGLAHPKREAWVLAGFEAQDAAEHKRLGELKQAIGSDPCVCSHELTARTKGSKRDIKRILDYLTDGDTTREPPCWQDTPLDRLKKRGQHNGLAAYLAEVETHLVPLLSAQ